jgi:hypothetical protein
MEVIIKITANEAIDMGIWDQLCSIRDINVWSVSEGLINGDHEMILTKEEGKQLGILNTE